MAKKKKEEPKAIKMEIWRPAKPTINAKNIAALETLMSDEGFRNEIGHKFEGVIDAFKAGKKSK